MVGRKEFIIDDTTQLMELLTDCRELQEEELRLQQEMGILEEVIRKLITENAAAAIEQDDYNRRLEAHMDRYKAAEARYAEMQKEIQYNTGSRCEKSWCVYRNPENNQHAYRKKLYRRK